jgi:hypothetical protein
LPGVAGADATSQINLPALREALYAAEWDMSPFSTPIVLHALMLLGGEQSNAEKFNEGLAVILDNRLQMGMHGRRAKVSAYVSFWNTVVMLDIMEAASKGQDIRGLVSGEIYADISQAVESALAVSADEVCRQMAYHAARDFTNFDIIKLVYSKYNT